MENPESWDILTSSLNVTRLMDVSITWAFLVLQGLVRDKDGDRNVFATFVREVAAEGPVDGPSPAAGISSRLVRAGMTLPPAQRPDPDGQIAEARAKIVRDWLMAEG